MRQLYTDDLIRFIYNETAADEHKAIEEAIRSSSEIRAAYESLKDTINQLDQASMLPDPSSIRIIMEESSKQSAELAH